MFITFEGIEGSGKTTQLRRLAARLPEAVITKEPGGTPLADEIRGILLDARSRLDPLAELFLFAASRRQNVVEVIRPALDDGRVVPNFVGQALRGEPLTVHGDGSQTRSFTYVSDLVAGIWRLMQAGVNEPVNLGNPREMTLLELAKQVLRLSGSRSEIVFGPLPTDDPKVRQPDIGRARHLLGWEPRVEVEEGLRRTIEWYRSAGGAG